MPPPSTRVASRANLRAPAAAGIGGIPYVAQIVNARWDPAELQQIDDARELEISGRRRDGSLRSWLPIWVVRVGDQVCVRTWHRRTTGWFGAAVRTGQARIRAGSVETDVTVEDLGAAGELRAAVDAAYVAKYASYGAGNVGQMTGASAVATTLRLSPTDPRREP